MTITLLVGRIAGSGLHDPRQRAKHASIVNFVYKLVAGAARPTHLTATRLRRRGRRGGEPRPTH